MQAPRLWLALVRLLWIPGMPAVLVACGLPLVGVSPRTVAARSVVCPTLCCTIWRTLATTQQMCVSPTVWRLQVLRHALKHPQEFRRLIMGILEEFKEDGHFLPYATTVASMGFGFTKARSISNQHDRSALLHVALTATVSDLIEGELSL